MLFYKCKGCGNFVTFLGPKSGCTPKCCGETMTEITPNTTDAATEKHVPVVTVNNNRVHIEVGSVTHPMQEAHHIEWIILETKDGFQKADLDPEGEPAADFALVDGEYPVAAYESCNLHGVWKAEIQ